MDSRRPGRTAGALQRLCLDEALQLFANSHQRRLVGTYGTDLVARCRSTVWAGWTRGNPAVASHLKGMRVFRNVIRQTS